MLWPPFCGLEVFGTKVDGTVLVVSIRPVTSSRQIQLPSRADDGGARSQVEAAQARVELAESNSLKGMLHSNTAKGHHRAMVMRHIFGGISREALRHAIHGWRDAVLMEAQAEQVRLTYSLAC